MNVCYELLCNSFVPIGLVVFIALFCNIVSILLDSLNFACETLPDLCRSRALLCVGAYSHIKGKVHFIFSIVNCDIM